MPYLNDPNDMFLPVKEAFLQFCAMRSPVHANRFILTQRHDFMRIEGEMLCVKCWRTLREIEEAFEQREKNGG